MSTPYYNANTGNVAPIIVQGRLVDNRDKGHALIPQHKDALSSISPLEGEWIKSEPQPRQCRDAFWAGLFYFQLALIAFSTAMYAPQMSQDLAEDYGGGAQRKMLSSRYLKDYGNQENGDFNLEIGGLLWILVMSGFAGFIISSFAMMLLIRFPQGLIKMALFFNIIMATLMTLLAFVSGAYGMAAIFGLGLLFSGYYCYVVWPRIPFAAANLVTASTAVRGQLGLAFFAYNNLVINFLWSLWWAVAFIATFYVLGACDAEGNCENETNGSLLFLFLVSYFWTAQVIKNVVHTTVAGSVGTFWFNPEEAKGCCSRGVRESYIRSITTSFGSICLGSLIVAIIQATKEILHTIREQEDSLFSCLADCLLGCIESLVENFNQWAFVYVGLYGYSFVEAGKNVMRLFRARGWTAIIADMLVDTALMMVSLGVGVLTGILGLIMGSMMELENEALASMSLMAIAVGIIMCSTLFSLISSAVNATIVLYAEAPAEFEANHPQLSQQMRDAWRQAYPVEFQY